MKYLQILALLMLHSLVEGVHAQFTNPPYWHYSIRDGLPQMQVMSMFTDSRGYLWIGTKGGVCRYNGKDFERPVHADSLPGHEVSSFAEDSEGRIWMSTTSGLASYDGSKLCSYFDVDRVYVWFAHGPDGRIWYAGSNAREGYYSGYFKNGFYTTTLKFPRSKSNEPSGIAVSWEDNAVLMNTCNEIIEVSHANAIGIFHTTDSLAIVQTRDKSLYYADFKDTANFTILKYRSGKFDVVTKILDGKVIGENQLKSPVFFSIKSQFGRIMLTVFANRIVIDDYHEIQYNSHTYDYNEGLWIGSEDGLYRIFNPGFETFKKELLPQVWSVSEDREGNMLFGSFHFGLKKFDGTKIRPVDIPEIPKDKLGFYFKTALNDQGAVLIPAGSGILSLQNPERKIIGTGPALTVFYDKESKLTWSGQQWKASVYNSANELVRTIDQSKGLEIRNYVVTINKDVEGYFWLGSFSGLARYNWGKDSLVNYNRKNNRLPADGVISIHNDYKGITWFGTTHGLCRYNQPGDSIDQVGLSQIPGQVSLVTSADSSWLIVSQPEGIYFMDLKTYHETGKVILHLFNQSNGFMGIEPGQDGAFTDSKGNIWITSATEVSRLNTKKLRWGNERLNVRFTSCNGKPLSFSENLVTLPVNISSATVNFEAICFNLPNPVQYSWKLSSVSSEWSSWEESNSVILTGLTHGKTVISLRARVPGLPLPAFANVSLIIFTRIAIYKREWFFPALFGLFAFASILALALLFRTRVRMIDATRQAKVVQVRAIQAQMNPHFIFNVLAALQSMILSLNLEDANKYLIKLAKLIRGYLDASGPAKFVAVNKPESNNVPLKLEIQMLKDYVDFQQLVFPNVFQTVWNIDPGINLDAIRIPPMLIQPFVENAIRHGLLLSKSNGILSISITPLPGYGIKVEVRDNGIGIRKAATIIRKSPYHYDSKGRDLTFTRVQLLNELGYDIQINTESSDQGTVVTLNIKKK